MLLIYRAVWILPTEYTWPTDNAIAHITYMAQVKLYLGIELMKDMSYYTLTCEPVFCAGWHQAIAWTSFDVSS